MLSHSTSLVFGKSTVDDIVVSMLYDVTFVASGVVHGASHTMIGRGVMLGAGAKIIGAIEIGHCARVAAGSVVLKPVPHNTTVAGVPAKVIGEAGCPEPSRSMDQMFPHSDI